MLINVDINSQDNFSAYILRWIPPPGKIADCHQVSPKCSILERSCFIRRFSVAKHSIVANKIYEYNLSKIKRLVYVMENYL